LKDIGVSLAPGVVDVWCIDVRGSPEDRAIQSQWLKREERDQADRFLREIDRTRFVLTRSMLRRLLAEYVHTTPECIQFSQGFHGKPELAGEPRCPVRFNVSHSGARAAMAFALQHEVGVDIEQHSSSLNWQIISRQFFSPMECRVLESIPVDQRVGAFFDTWTRKESFIKAVGNGLSYGLDSFCVQGVGEPALLVAPVEDLSRWWMGCFDAGSDYSAAVSVRRSANDVSPWPPILSVHSIGPGQ